MKSLAGARLWLTGLAYLLVYAAFDMAARVFEVAPGVSLWYPPVGLELACAILLGWRSLPWILAGNFYSVFVTSDAPVAWNTIALAVVIAWAYFTAGLLVHRRFGPLPAPSRPSETSYLITLCFIPPLAVSALGSLLMFGFGGFGHWEGLQTTAQWWIGDLTGVLTVVPLCLVHVAPRIVQEDLPRRDWTRREILEVIAQGAVLIGSTLLVYGFDAGWQYQSRYLCFVPLVWICLRHGLPGATIATCALTMGNLAATRLAGASEHIVVDLLLFEIALASVGLGLGLVVSRRLAAEQERARLLTILEATPDFIGTAQLDGRVVYQNAAFLRFCGCATLAEARTKRMGDFHSPASAGRLRSEAVPAALAQGAWNGEMLFVDHAGREVPVLQLIFVHRDAHGRPALFSTVARDINPLKQSERARLEAERSMLQAQKLESLGVLAGGIAHDFNNLLTTMLGNAALARLDIAADTAAERSVHQIELAALRAAELCRQMLAYAGKGRLASAQVDLNALVEETTHLLHASISKKVSLAFALGEALPPVHGDAAQLSQIAMNLVVNASDAIGDRSGHIVVHTGVVAASAEYLANAYLSPNLAPGEYVFLEVEDDGCGMTPEVQARIFEPFFTTKFSGHGLGLSAVLGIARSHQGALKVESAPGRGTRFRLLLPAVRQPVEPPAAAAQAGLEKWRGSGCVLVADDEEAVRSVSALLLERSGFTVETACDGRQAVELFRARRREFRAVLLDLTMPVLDGAEALREIHGIDPTVPVVLMSGYSERHSAQRIGGEGRAAGFVQKPFQSVQLFGVLRGALEAGEAEKILRG